MIDQIISHFGIAVRGALSLFNGCRMTDSYKRSVSPAPSVRAQVDRGWASAQF
jgi:hypothetical protein